MFGATVGALAGSALPIERVQGLDFALTALFVVLAIDAYRSRPDRVMTACAACCGVVAVALIPGQTGWRVRRIHGDPARQTSHREAEGHRWLIQAHIAAMVAVSAAITWCLRGLPFAVLAPMRRSVAVAYLSLHMPLGIMVILAFYTLRDVPTAGALRIWATVAALAVTIVLHARRHNALTSIVGGTLTNVLIVSLMG